MTGRGAVGFVVWLELPKSFILPSTNTGTLLSLFIFLSDYQLLFLFFGFSVFVFTVFRLSFIFPLLPAFPQHFSHHFGLLVT